MTPTESVKEQRPIEDASGFLLLDKPPGITSNRALQRVKRTIGARKAGHTGSLDPLATGMLPICVGSATRLSSMLLSADKTYTVTAALGAETDSGDSDGRVIETLPAEHVDADAAESVLARFQGRISQVPPMYSALKHQGARLYRLARQGIAVERAPREVTIHRLTLDSFDFPSMTLTVECTKGTYIRSLVVDIGKALGTAAHVTALRRTGVGPFSHKRMFTLDEIEHTALAGPAALDRILLPLDSVLGELPRIRLRGDMVRRLRNGEKLPVEHELTSGVYRAYSEKDDFIGLAELSVDGVLAPKRIFAR